MAQLIIPNEIAIQGPWILQESELDELGNVIEKIDLKLEDAFHLVIENEAKKNFDEFKKYDEEITLDSAKQKIAKSYPFYNKASSATLFSKNRKKLVDDSLISLLKDKNLNEFYPSELLVNIQKGPIEFTLDLSSEHDGELHTRLKIDDDNIAGDINYELNQWIRKNRPNLVLQKWSSWFPFALFMVFALLLIFSSAFIEKDKDAYKNELRNQAEQILIDGLSKEETQNAVEIMLKLETGFVPQNYTAKSTKNSMLFNIWIVFLIIAIILLIKPKTIIGLGKNKWKASFFKKWIYFVFVFIPLSILVPILRGKLF